MVAGSQIITKERPSLILKDNESDPDYAVIVQNNLGNRYSGTVILVPITSTVPAKEFPFNVRIKNLTSQVKDFADGVIKCNQIFTVDKCWITNVKGTLNLRDMKLIDKALINGLGITA